MKYLLMRRFVQIGILILYFGANAYGWKILQGDLSGSLLFDLIPLGDPFAVIQMLVAGAALAADILVGAVIIAVFYTIVGGRAFCSWVCPINMVTDLANWLRRRLGIAQVQKRVYMSRSIRYWVLGLSLLLSAVMGVAAFEMISLTSTFVFSVENDCFINIGYSIVIFYSITCFSSFFSF
jgi:ferredoxin-type protein NapH